MDPTLERRIDERIGRRLRLRRKMLAVKVADLARGCGISVQQIHNYELGASRIPASRLQHLAEIMETPVAWFFDNGEPRGS
ncbi:MAG TPA: helix-turn-helix transcriptional regulator [Caulobacteraceae bacterium]|nr:helix-turn-helix transcriptional regulator [Caulobacteraceae bacterium]